MIINLCIIEIKIRGRNSIMKNNYEENQLKIFSNQYLKEIGMGINEDLSDFNINSNKYKKIDNLEKM